MNWQLTAAFLVMTLFFVLLARVVFWSAFWSLMVSVLERTGVKKTAPNLLQENVFEDRELKNDGADIDFSFDDVSTTGINPTGISWVEPGKYKVAGNKVEKSNSWMKWMSK